MSGTFSPQRLFVATQSFGKLLRDLYVETRSSLTILRQHAPFLFVCMLTIVAVTSALPFLLSWLFGRELDQLEGQPSAKFLGLLVVLTWGLLQLTESVQTYIATEVEEFFRAYYPERLLRLRIAVGTNIFDKRGGNAKLAERMKQAEDGEYWGPRLLQFMVMMLAGGVRAIAGMLYLLVCWPSQVWLPFLVCLLALVVRGRFALRHAQAEREGASEQGRVTTLRNKFNYPNDLKAILLQEVAEPLKNFVCSLIRLRSKKLAEVNREDIFGKAIVTLLLIVTLYFVFHSMEALVRSAPDKVTIGSFSFFWTSLLAALAGMDSAIYNLSRLAARADQLSAPREIETEYAELIASGSRQITPTQLLATSERIGSGTLSVRNLNFGFSDRSPLFQNVSVEFPPGLTVMVGVNGAGKTTLCNLFTGVIDPPSDSIFLGDCDINTLSRPELRRLILHCPQHPTPWKALPYRQPFRFIHPEKALEDDLVYQALDWAGIGGTIRERPEGLDTDDSVWGKAKASFDLSGGYVARYNMAMVRFSMLTWPSRFILWDEPFAALDGPTIEELFERIRNLDFENRSVVLVLHHAHLIAENDNVLFLDRPSKDGKAYGVAKVVLGRHCDLKRTHENYLAFVERRRAPVEVA